MNRERGRSVFFFRKWYFDAQTADGTFLFAYFAPMTLFGSRSAELVISIYPPGGVELRRSFHLRGDGIRLAPDHSRAEFGSGSLSVSKGTATLEFSIDDTSLFLHYTSGAAAWIPTLPGLEPGVLLSNEITGCSPGPYRSPMRRSKDRRASAVKQFPSWASGTTISS